MIAGAVFPVGLVAIVITGMSLFTSDTMLIPVAVFQGKTTWQKGRLGVAVGLRRKFRGFPVLGLLDVLGALPQYGTAELSVFGQSAVAMPS